jgi:hypothetical protein
MIYISKKNMKEAPEKNELIALYEKLNRIRSTRYKMGAPEIEKRIEEIENKKSRL